MFKYYGDTIGKNTIMISRDKDADYGEIFLNHKLYFRGTEKKTLSKAFGLVRKLEAEVNEF